MYIIDKEIIKKSIDDVMSRLGRYPFIDSIMFSGNENDKIKAYKEMSERLEIYVLSTVIYDSEKELLVSAIKHIISGELEEYMYDIIIKSCKKDFIIKAYLNFIINSKLKSIELELSDMKKFILNKFSE